MKLLSKSKLLAFLQCPRRLWLEEYHPELMGQSAATEQRLDVGNTIGQTARKLYDRKGTGVLIDINQTGYRTSLTQSAALLASRQPIFEGILSGGGGLAFADIMLPTNRLGRLAWRILEVKSATSVKNHHRDEAAILSFVANAAAVHVASISVAHVNSAFKYPGDGAYKGLFEEVDLTKDATKRHGEVSDWISKANNTLSQKTEPAVKTGPHCGAPYECEFSDYCKSKEPKAKYPIAWLPRIQAKALKAHIADGAIIDLQDISDELLNERQKRVKNATLSGKSFFDRVGAAADLAPHKLPAYFLDFETINFAVPRWKGTFPYQQIPFQFSLHRISKSEELEQFSFLDLTGNDPSKQFASELVAACGKSGPIFVYNAGFETARISELAKRYSRFRQELLTINARVVDLLEIAGQRFYHPDQHGSWSIKKLLPAIAPDLRYDALDGVQDGGMAMNAYLHAISQETPESEKEIIRGQLLAYCELDTLAMVRIWRFFSGCE